MLPGSFCACRSNETILNPKDMKKNSRVRSPQRTRANFQTRYISAGGITQHERGMSQRMAAGRGFPRFNKRDAKRTRSRSEQVSESLSTNGGFPSNSMFVGCLNALITEERAMRRSSGLRHGTHMSGNQRNDTNQSSAINMFPCSLDNRIYWIIGFKKLRRFYCQAVCV
jgi:hypothetical protein